MKARHSAPYHGSISKVSASGQLQGFRVQGFRGFRFRVYCRGLNAYGVGRATALLIFQVQASTFWGCGGVGLRVCGSVHIGQLLGVLRDCAAITTGDSTGVLKRIAESSWDLCSGSW